MIVQDIVRVHHAIRSVVVTRSVEDVVQVLQLHDGDVARSLHDGVVHTVYLLTCHHEVILLISIVERGAEGQVLYLVRTTCRECVPLVAVGIGRNDTVILHLRERNKEVAGISCTVK